MGPATTDAHTSPIAPRGRYLLSLCLAALGVVYGDIGTSPLYALRECFHGPHGLEPTPANVLGVLSLVFWSLVLVIGVKYLAFILRADNRGEGGVLALLALATPARGANAASGRRRLLLLLGVFGAALLYGDGMITPAISVLSAVEGLEIAAPRLERWVEPITIGILIALFLVQRHGTTRVGRVFGPITLVWFLALAVLGVAGIAGHPAVLAAVSPTHALAFFAANGRAGFLTLAAVVLVVTGGEALYADMGHFGVRPIRLMWFGVAFPALLLNYFGQGALLVADPAAAENPFYLLAPGWALYPLTALATAATVIASQAVITGAFSLTRQAVQLGYCPRVAIEHTSSREIGQIYIPSVNRLLMLACIGLVLGFHSSAHLAAAYGIAVTSTMLITTLLFAVVALRRWGWPAWAVGVLTAAFLVLDAAFLAANAVKIVHGGWFPLALAGAVFVLMTTWKKGRRVLTERMPTAGLTLEDFLHGLAHHPPMRVPGTAVFMYRRRGGTPPALLHNLKHNKVLHERCVVLTIEVEEVPRVDQHRRFEVEAIRHGFHGVAIRYGFMEDPDIPEVLSRVRLEGRPLDLAALSYFVGRESVIATPRPGMALWREKLFVWMFRNERSATAYFGLPPNQVIELGSQVEL